MPDVAVTTTNVVSLVKSTRTTISTLGQSVVTGSTAVLTPQAGAPFKGRYMLVRVNPGAASTLSVQAGVTGGTPANQAALGALSVASFAVDSVIQLDLARHQQADGTVRVDVGGTGPVVFTVLHLSKSA